MKYNMVRNYVGKFTGRIVVIDLTPGDERGDWMRSQNLMYEVIRGEHIYVEVIDDVMIISNTEIEKTLSNKEFITLKGNERGIFIDGDFELLEDESFRYQQEIFINDRKLPIPDEFQDEDEGEEFSFWNYVNSLPLVYMEPDLLTLDVILDKIERIELI